MIGSTLISVIVPVFKVEKYLDKCIESIVNQTYSNLEIILVDDGSPDNCPKICDEWAKKDSRIKVIHQKNSGVSAARNNGIQMAQGRYLYFVDGDDWIVPELCEKVMQIFSSHDVDIVIFDCEKIDENGKKDGGTETLNEGTITVEEALKDLLKGHINNYAWNKVYKREVFEGIIFPARTAFEDMAVTYKLFLNAKKIFCLNEKLYFYLQRTGSATANIGAKKLGELYLSRLESYTNIRRVYPNTAEVIYPTVALCALRLYDRSLWEDAEEEVLNSAKNFLKENREKILSIDGSLWYRLYYSSPFIYGVLRRGKHCVGNLVRKIK